MVERGQRGCPRTTTSPDRYFEEVHGHGPNTGIRTLAWDLPNDLPHRRPVGWPATLVTFHPQQIGAGGQVHGRGGAFPGGAFRMHGAAQASSSSRRSSPWEASQVKHPGCHGVGPEQEVRVRRFRDGGADAEEVLVGLGELVGHRGSWRWRPS